MVVIFGPGAFTLLNSLTDLYVSDTKITDAGLQSLGGHQSLKTLDLCGTQVKSSAFVCGGSLLTNSKTLNMGFTQVTGKDLGNFDNLFSIGVLDLRGNRITNERYHKPLKRKHPAWNILP